MVVNFVPMEKRERIDKAMMRAIILKFRMLDRLLSVKPLPRIIEVYQTNFNHLYHLIIHSVWTLIVCEPPLIVMIILLGERVTSSIIPVSSS